jgi:hypothetical protein
VQSSSVLIQLPRPCDRTSEGRVANQAYQALCTAEPPTPTLGNGRAAPGAGAGEIVESIWAHDRGDPVRVRSQQMRQEWRHRVSH